MQRRKNKNLILLRVGNLWRRNLPDDTVERLRGMPDDTMEIQPVEKLSFLRYFAKFLLVK